MRKKGEPKIPKCIRLTQTHHEFIHQLSHQRGIPFSTILQLIIDKEMAQYLMNEKNIYPYYIMSSNHANTQKTSQDQSNS